MQNILIDSGPLIALFDATDRYHMASVNFIKQNKARLISSLASITETLHLLGFSRCAQADFLTWINAGAVNIETIANEDLVNIKNMMVKYSDLPMDFADACLIHLGDKLNIDCIATIDRDFDIYRRKNKQPFTTLVK